MNRDDAANLIARHMPGWRLVEPTAGVSLAADAASDGPTDEGPSLATLRRKFLGDDTADGVQAEEAFAPSDEDVLTVQIEPEGGGPRKTADVRNGQVTIVQG